MKNSSPQPNFESFSSFDKREARITKNVLTPSKSPSSANKYVPPNMRGKTIEAAQPRASTPSPTRKRVLKGPQTHILDGPLHDNALEIFERAHGLNSRDQVDLLTLQEEVMAKYNCSEKAFQSLVLGRSYNDLLGPLRDQVPGYLTQKELKKQNKASALAKRQRAKSCNSSPSVLSQSASPLYTPFLMLSETESPPPLKLPESPIGHYPQHGRRRLFSEPQFEKELLTPKSVLLKSTQTPATLPTQSIPSDICKGEKGLSAYSSSNISESDAVCGFCSSSTSEAASLTAATILFAATDFSF